VSRYTPPNRQPRTSASFRHRPRWVRIGVWALLGGVVALVLSDVALLLLR
jgi:hypothetical protein